MNTRENHVQTNILVPIVVLILCLQYTIAVYYIFQAVDGPGLIYENVEVQVSSLLIHAWLFRSAVTSLNFNY